MSLLIVFLCLAALYGSWSVPISVMLVVPLGVVGALLAATLTGENNDIYLQVGLITTIGVSAKNAILIVKFADDCMSAGRAFDAAIEAAKLRLRPILMTSLAFVIGVFARDLDRGRCRRTERDRPRGGWRYAVGNDLGDLFRADVFHCRAAIVRSTPRPQPGRCTRNRQK